MTNDLILISDIILFYLPFLLLLRHLLGATHVTPRVTPPSRYTEGSDSVTAVVRVQISTVICYVLSYLS